MSLEDLITVVGSPGRGNANLRIDWSSVERSLGGRLPDDYRELVERYGEVSFSQFIHIFHPNSELSTVNLMTQAHVTIDALRYLRDRGEFVPYSIEVDPAELLAFGRTDNGDVLYWVRSSGVIPNEWTVAVNASRDDRWFEYQGSMTTFLAHVLKGALRVPMFPQSFPSGQATFESY